MTPQEVIQILATCKAIDARFNSGSNAEQAAWTMLIGDLDFTAARSAVARHYATSTVKITPQMVRAGAK